ncbi:MAG: aldo/keto reductase [Clostridia bacterium]|nr:aldo/keto reductase [Clostridia bacterium]
MIYKEFGRTGKMVSALGFGGMRFPLKDGKYDYDYCTEMIHEASRLGINYFDTAPFYNNDQSEIIFGNAFEAMPNDFFVSTKCSSLSGDELRTSLEKSLTRLKVPKINFFHIWCVMKLEDFEKRMAPGGPYEELLKAREEGLIEHICVSTHCAGAEIAEIASRRLFDGITLGYNIINYKYRQEGMKAAFANGAAVVTMNPLGGGLVTDNPEYFSYIKDIDDMDTLDAAIRFNASHREITVVLTGMDSIEHVQRNVSSVEMPLSIEYVEKAIERTGNHAVKAMDALCTGCRYCEHCPVEIPVSKLMQAYNYNILADAKSVKANLRNHWGVPQEIAGTCIECGLCEEKCTQHLPIIERLKEIACF